MNPSEPDWDLYRAFLGVVRTESLSGAARLLGLTQPTIGRQIAALEERLGVPLFTRSRHGLKPTDIALDLVPHAETMANAAAALGRAASGEAEEERGTIRITASDVVGSEVLPAMLTRFHEAHPQIELELVVSDRVEDLLKREADIAVRMIRPEQTALVARHIGPVPLSLYAHRAYLERRGTPANVEELSRHTLIGYDANPWAAGFAASHGWHISREMFALRTDSDLAQLAALRAGFGICGCQDPLAKRDPNLVPVLADTVKLALDLWLVMHEDLRASRRVRLLFDHLVRELTDYLK